MYGIPLLPGFFSEAEWYAAYRTSLSHEDALQEAKAVVEIRPEDAWRSSMSIGDIAVMSLISPELAARVDDYLRTAQRGWPVHAVKEFEREWPRIRQIVRDRAQQANDR
jgi:hypothetical protein